MKLIGYILKYFIITIGVILANIGLWAMVNYLIITPLTYEIFCTFLIVILTSLLISMMFGIQEYFEKKWKGR